MYDYQGTAFNVGNLSSLPESLKNKVWQTYRSFYISLKKKIQHVYINHHAALKDRYNDCIGKEDKNVVKKYTDIFIKKVAVRDVKHLSSILTTLEAQTIVTDVKRVRADAR